MTAVKGQVNPERKWISLLRQVDSLYKNHNYDLAVPIAKQTIEQAELVFGKNNTNYCESLIYLAIIYKAKGLYNQALPIFQEALQIRKELFLGEKNSAYISSLTSVALMQYYLVNYSEALSLFQHALQLSKEVSGEKSNEYIIILNNIANIYKETNQKKLAISSLQKACQLAETINNKNVRIYPNLLRNLAEVYEDTVQYGQALELLEKVLKIQRETLDEIDADYILSLNNLAELHQAMGHYETALAILQQILEIRKKTSTEIPLDYSISLANLGGINAVIGKYEKALEFFQQSYQVISALSTTNTSPQLISALDNLGTIYTHMGQFQKAEDYYQQALQLQEKFLTKNLVSRAKIFTNLANLYKEKGQFNQALALFETAMKMRKEFLGEKHPDYATSLNNLGEIYETMGQYSRTLPLLQQSLVITKNAFGANHPEYSSTLANLANYYTTIGQYEKARALLLQALAITKENLGETHPTYATCIENLAGLYKAMGEYDQALPLIKEALAIRKNAFGEKHPLYANSTDNLANLYSVLGQTDQALPLYQQAVQLRKDILGEYHPDYGISLSNLAGTYEKLNQKQVAKSMYEEVLSIIQTSLGNTHPLYATTLSNLAGIYNQTGQYDQAISLFQKVIALRKESLGELHPDYATSLHNLAVAYFDSDHKEISLSYFQQVLRLRKKILGETHPDYAASLTSLAINYAAINNYSNVSSLLTQAFTIRKARLLNDIAILGEQALQKYRRLSNYSAIEASFQLNRPFLQITGTLYNEILLSKGLSLMANQKLRQLLQTGSDTTTKALYSQFVSLKKQLAYSYANPKSQKKYIDSLQKESVTLEESLRLRLPAYRKAFNNLTIQWDQIQKVLKPDEVAIEFIDFPYWKNQQVDSTYYAALVLRAGEPAPKLVYLCQKNQLQPLLSRSSDIQVRKQEYVNQIYTKNLFDLLWSPIDTLLRGIRTIYYSPSGLLYRLNFNALPVGNGQTLLDKYQFIQLISTRQLINHDSVNSAYVNQSLLIGNVTFDLDSSMYRKLNRRLYSATNPLSQDFTRTANGSYWPPLPYTNAEVDRVDSLLYVQNYDNLKLKNLGASEEAFYYYTNPENYTPRYIHLATHGYFQETLDKPNPSRSRYLNDEPQPYKQADNPLMRSGVVLAGGNYAWQGGKPLEQQEDGILTAYEISRLNLDKTEMVVLSACDTGLGEVTDAEGVYGLQRAFKMAGVKSLLVSLWQVGDQGTQKFMQKFYKLVTVLPLRQAYLDTLKFMKNESSNPYDWAAFVLIE